MALKIAIIGGGIAGLTAAIAFARRGSDVSVYERASAFTEVGAGLQITPNALYVFEALGIADDLRAIGIRANAVVLRDFRVGKEVTTLDLGTYAEDQEYNFVHRADLIAFLVQACRNLNVDLHLNEEISDVSCREGTFRDASGAVISADLVIGAEGIHSSMRAILNGPSTPVFRKQVAWRTLVPNVFDHPNCAQIHMGPGRHIVTYPIREGQLVNMVAVQERREWAEEGWMHEDDPDNLRCVFLDFGGPVRRLLDAVEDVRLWGLFGHPVAEKWFSGRTVLMGDAAHPTLPFLAQGANMAIEDAWVLAEQVCKSDQLDAGLRRYQELRRPRVERIIKTSANNAWKYHLQFGPLRFAAHSAMRTMGLVAPQRLVGSYDWLYRHDVTRGDL